MSQQAKVILISKVPCPYCVRAKNFMKARDIEFEEVDLTGKEDEIIAQKHKWGWATVPIIIINNKCIGGYDDLKALEESGQLESLLDEKY